MSLRVDDIELVERDLSLIGNRRGTTHGFTVSRSSPYSPLGTINSVSVPPIESLGGEDIPIYMIAGKFAGSEIGAVRTWDTGRFRGIAKLYVVVES